MIKERHMKQAKRLDNGELVQGYLYITHKGEYEIGSYNSELNIERITYIVDPATVEDVAVKLIEKYDKDGYYQCWCPNCNKENMNPLARFKFCPECGQRWQWN